jgi:DNA-binding IclR family transcriptional regulator
VPDTAEPVLVKARQQFRPAADELVRSGVTSKHPAIVAAVLADHAAGTPPSTIGRRHKLHHSTVGRILAGAEALTG